MSGHPIHEPQINLKNRDSGIELETMSLCINFESMSIETNLETHATGLKRRRSMASVWGPATTQELLPGTKRVRSKQIRPDQIWSDQIKPEPTAPDRVPTVGVPVCSTIRHALSPPSSTCLLKRSMALECPRSATRRPPSEASRNGHYNFQTVALPPQPNSLQRMPCDPCDSHS